MRPPTGYQRDYDELGPILSQHLMSTYHSTSSSLVNGCNNYLGYEPENDLDCNSVEYEGNEIELFTSHEDDHGGNVDVVIKGRRTEDDNIFLRLRIADKEGKKICDKYSFYFINLNIFLKNVLYLWYFLKSQTLDNVVNCDTNQESQRKR